MGGATGRFTGTGVGRKALLKLWERDHGICHLCGEAVNTMTEATRDHVIPLSLGGCTCTGNIALAHRGCNNRRNSRPAVSVGMKSQRRRKGHLLVDH